MPPMAFPSREFEQGVVALWAEALSSIHARKGRSFFRNKGNMDEIATFQKASLQLLNEKLKGPLEYVIDRIQSSPAFVALFRARKSQNFASSLKEAAFELAEEVHFVAGTRMRVQDSIRRLSEQLHLLEVDLIKMVSNELMEKRGNFRLFLCDVLFMKFTVLKSIAYNTSEDMMRRSSEVIGFAPAETTSLKEQSSIKKSDDLLIAEDLIKRSELILNENIKELLTVYKLPIGAINRGQIEETAYEFLAIDPSGQDPLAFLTTHSNVLKEDEQIPPKIKSKANYSQFDLILVLLHTSLFMTGLYGMAITSYRYLISLGIDSSISGALQAATPIGATIFSFFLNWYTNKRRYKMLYLICISLLMIGHLIYFLAEAVKSSSSAGMAMLVISRLLIGAGGARMMTRKYLNVFVAMWAQGTYQFIFVALTCIALCLGPGLSAALEYAVPTNGVEDHVNDGKIIKPWNVISFAFVFVYAILLVPFIFWFKGTDLDEKESKGSLNTSDTQDSVTSCVSYTQQKDIDRLNSILGLASVEVKEDILPVTIERSETLQPVSLIDAASGWKISVSLPNWQLFLSVTILLFIKIVQEGFFIELPQLSILYYKNDTKWSGFFLLISICVLLPVSIGAIILSRYVRDATVLMIGLVSLFASALIKINYQYDKPMNEVQYYFGSILYFASFLVAESASGAIIAKTATPRFKTNFFNSGMLAGSADTIGRAIGSGLFTLYSLVHGKATVPFYQYTINGGMILCMIIATAATWKYLLKYSFVRMVDMKGNAVGF